MKDYEIRKELYKDKKNCISTFAENSSNYQFKRNNLKILRASSIYHTAFKTQSTFSNNYKVFVSHFLFCTAISTAITQISTLVNQVLNIAPTNRTMNPKFADMSIGRSNSKN